MSTTARAARKAADATEPALAPRPSNRTVPLDYTISATRSTRPDNSPLDAGVRITQARALLDVVLGELAELGVRIPAGTQRALDIASSLATQPSGITTWLSSQSLTELTPEVIADRMREYLIASVAGDAEGRVGQEVAQHLLDRALDALADGLDDVADQLRPRWDTAATVVAAAAQAGVTSATSAEQAISDDALVEHWRALGPAVAELELLDRVMLHALFVTGHPLGEHEQARVGRAAWLDSCAGGPAALVAPSARTVSPAPPGHRPGVAAELGERILSPAARLARAQSAQAVLGGLHAAGLTHVRAHAANVPQLERWAEDAPAEDAPAQDAS